MGYIVLKQIVLTSCMIFGLTFVLMYIFQRHLIYFPDKNRPDLQKYDATEMNLVTIHASDGIALTSWYKPAPGSHPTILFLHGNAGHIGYRMPIARQLIHAGFGVLLLEYRGYGGNSGAPTESGLYEDGQSALRFLTQQGVNLQNVVVYGESLGTGVATQLATNAPVCGLILQSPFTSLTSLSQYHYPWLFLNPWDRFDSLQRVKSIQVPLLVLYGTQDQIVPPKQSIALYEEANEPKKIASFEGKNHNDLWSDNPELVDNIKSFIQDHCPYQ